MVSGQTGVDWGQSAALIALIGLATTRALTGVAKG